MSKNKFNLSILIGKGAFVWIIIELILSLVKYKSFNWYSVVLFAAMYLVQLYSDSVRRRKVKKHNEHCDKMPKSSFHGRLNDLKDK